MISFRTAGSDKESGGAYEANPLKNPPEDRSQWRTPTAEGIGILPPQDKHHQHCQRNPTLRPTTTFPGYGKT